MTTQPETRGRNPAELEREIEATRDRMSEDIDAIGEKFTPEHIKYRAREALHSAREAAMDRTREAGNGLLEMVRNNPVPAAMIGAGVAWLMADRRSNAAKMRRYGRRYDVRYDRMGYRYSEPDDWETGEGDGPIQRVKEKAEDLSGQAREKAHQLTDQAGEKIQQAGERIQQFREDAMGKARYAEQELEGFFERSPLIAAAGLAVLGAAIGVMLPRTEPEDRLLGSMSDRVTDKARETAREVTERAKGAAQGAVETFTENFDKSPGQGQHTSSP